MIKTSTKTSSAISITKATCVMNASLGTLRSSSGPETALVNDQLGKVIFLAIDGLPEELKVALTLREFEGLSYEEIAEVMECPVGTVRSRIFRAREAIEKRIAAIG